MLIKNGIVTNRAKKAGPNVHDAIKASKKFAKKVLCSCGAELVKECPSEAMCDVSVLTCPHCGAKVK
jgi:hypothetical protein